MRLMQEFTAQLANGPLTRIDLDLEHHYFSDGVYFVSLTRILDMGAPFPEGLRQYLRLTDPDESAERLQMTKDRGSKLHHALEMLAGGMELYLEDYPTTYEKDAIVTFIRTMRFLYPDGWPKDNRTERIVADPKRRVGGTLDLFAGADKRRLEALLNPRKHLKLENDSIVTINPLEGPKRLVGFILDYKFTGRSTYNHEVQASKYRTMYNDSYKGKRATRAFTWRYSPRHKLGFDFREARLPASSFDRIYKTAIEYMGGFPEPPELKVYPESVRLFEKKGAVK